jgi:hypothetical protein
MVVAAEDKGSIVHSYREIGYPACPGVDSVTFATAQESRDMLVVGMRHLIEPLKLVDRYIDEDAG